MDCEKLFLYIIIPRAAAIKIVWKRIAKISKDKIKENSENIFKSSTNKAGWREEGKTEMCRK